MFLILTYKSYKCLKRFCWIKYIFWLLLINNSKQNIESYVIYPSIEISSFSLPLQSFSQLNGIIPLSKISQGTRDGSWNISCQIPVSAVVQSSLTIWNIYGAPYWLRESRSQLRSIPTTLSTQVVASFREQLANEIFTMAEFLLVVEIIAANFFLQSFLSASR